jgi:hypothetical protein
MKDKPYWCTYRDFHYGAAQICWMVQNEEFFNHGVWPPEPAGEYLTHRYDKHEKRWVDWVGCGRLPDDLGKPPLKCEASFCKAKLLYGEIMWRIKDTDEDGKLLLAQIRAGYEVLDDEAQNALAYACGRMPKVSGYEKWKWQRRGREK